MTEEVWLTSDNAFELHGFILQHVGSRRKAVRRKLRLLGCWGCRHLWDHLTDNRSRHAVDVAERLANGEATKAEIAEAIAGADRARWPHRPDEYTPWTSAVAHSAMYLLSNQAVTFSLGGLSCAYFPEWPEHPGLTRGQTAASAVRCIFGNPFRPVQADPLWLAWNDGTVKRMAQSIYDECAWEQLPILADALEDAGCTHEDMLTHCRGPGPHTRGCWVVDLLLGKG